MSLRILIGICGSIAAYKVCEVVSSLAKQGIAVQVIMTDSATKFVSPLTFATLSRHRTFTDRDFWHEENGKPLHIVLGEWADIFVIAPLSANTLSKLTWGLADNLLLNTVLASTCPVVLAPAMNTTMWLQESLQSNWQVLLKQARFLAILPEQGLLACDTIGTGRMAEPTTILRYIESIGFTKGKQDWQGKRVLVSAGGTKEFLDQVRFIGNPSTGKQGLAIAEAALHRGAQVTLIHTGIDNIPQGILAICVTSAQEMTAQLISNFANTDLTVMAAAVGDVRPVDYWPWKLAKSEIPDHLALKKIPDILLQLQAQRRSGQLLVGFAAQSGEEVEILEKGKEKLINKGLDAIVINRIDQDETGFAGDTNQAIFLDRQGKMHRSPLCSKLTLAHYLLDFLQDTATPNLH